MITLRRIAKDIKGVKFNRYNYKTIVEWIDKQSDDPYTHTYDVVDRVIRLSISNREIKLLEGDTLVYENGSFFKYTSDTLKKDFVEVK